MSASGQAQGVGGQNPYASSIGARNEAGGAGPSKEQSLTDAAARRAQQERNHREQLEAAKRRHEERLAQRGYQQQTAGAGAGAGAGARPESKRHEAPSVTKDDAYEAACLREALLKIEDEERDAALAQSLQDLEFTPQNTAQFSSKPGYKPKPSSEDDAYARGVADALRAQQQTQTAGAGAGAGAGNAQAGGGLSDIAKTVGGAVLKGLASKAAETAGQMLGDALLQPVNKTTKTSSFFGLFSKEESVTASPLSRGINRVFGAGEKQ